MDVSRALLDDLARVLVRDLEAVGREIDAYDNDEGPWRIVPGMSNCGGTLVLHLVGNLRGFIGAALGHSGYVREREVEFSRRDVTRAELHALVKATIAELQQAFADCAPAQVDAPFPLALGGRHPGTRIFLLHLAVHLGYHLGQLDTHRRVVTGDPRSIDAVAVAPLFE